MACKVCKLKPQMIAFIDDLISKGYGDTRIAKKTIREFADVSGFYGISPMSIRRHRLHKLGLPDGTLKKDELYIAFGRPIRGRY